MVEVIQTYSPTVMFRGTPCTCSKHSLIILFRIQYSCVLKLRNFLTFFLHVNMEFYTIYFFELLVMYIVLGLPNYTGLPTQDETSETTVRN